MWWEAPADATWSNGIDLITVRRALAERGPYPELTDEEQRYAVVESARTGVRMADIAARLGITVRMAERWKAAAELEQPGVTACTLSIS